MNTCIELKNMCYEFMLDLAASDQEIMESMIGSDIMELQGFQEADKGEDGNIVSKAWNWIKEQFKKLKEFIGKIIDKVKGFFRKESSSKDAKSTKEKLKRVENNTKSGSLYPLKVNIVAGSNLAAEYIEKIISGKGMDIADEINKECEKMVNYIKETVNKARNLASVPKNVESYSAKVESQALEYINDLGKLSDVNQDAAKETKEKRLVKTELQKAQCDSIINFNEKSGEIEKKCTGTLEKMKNIIASLEKQFEGDKPPFSKESITHLKKIVTSLTKLQTQATYTVSQVNTYAYKTGKRLLTAVNHAISKSGGSVEESFIFLDEYADELGASTSLDYLWN